MSFFSFQDAISGNDVKAGLDNSLSQAKSQITQAIKNKTARMTAAPIASQPKKRRRGTVKRSAIAPMFLLSFSSKNRTCRKNAQLQRHLAGVQVKRKQYLTLACVPLRM